MTVYIEDCIIENTFVTLLLLLCLNKIFKLNERKVKLVFVSFFSGLLATFYPLINLGSLLLIFKLCVGFLLVCLYSGKSKLLAKYIIFMLLTALYAGVNLMVYYLVYGSININDNFATYILIIILYIIYYLFCSCLELLKKNLVVANFIYDIKIENGNEIIKDTAFLDSGNTLLDNEDNSPIFIINFKLFNKLYKDVAIEDILSKNFKTLKNPHYVKSNFASGGAKILVFSVDKMEISSSAKKNIVHNVKLGLVYSKFNKNFNCNMLLNINAFS